MESCPKASPGLRPPSSRRRGQGLTLLAGPMGDRLSHVLVLKSSLAF